MDDSWKKENRKPKREQKMKNFFLKEHILKNIKTFLAIALFLFLQSPTYARKGPDLRFLPIDDEPISPSPSQKIWKDPYLGMEFVWVPGGCYKMGCGSFTSDCDSDEKPVHEVCVSGFWMGRYEVTVGQYLKCVDDGGCKAPEWLEEGSACNIHTGDDNYYKKLGEALTDKNYPIVGVSWNDAVAFSKWLSKKTGYKFRLPTEAEWEYACRSCGKEVKYGTSSGKISHDLANYDGTGGKDVWEHTSPVGSFPPNQAGLYDMSGNVWEWCLDVYNENAYSKHSKKDPVYKGLVILQFNPPLN